MNAQLDKMLLSTHMQVKAIVQIMQKCSTLKLVTAVPYYPGCNCASVPDTVLA